MSDDSDSQEKTLEASERRLQQAREDGNVAVSREGAAVGVLIGALLAIVLLGAGIASQVGNILLPMLDQPDAFLNATPQGWQAAGQAVTKAVMLAMLPCFGLIAAGGLLPHLLQNAITVSSKRITPKLSHLSPAAGIKRMVGLRALFEFAKSLAKMAAVAVGCWVIARPLYEQSVGLVSTDLGVLPTLLRTAIGSLLLVATLVAAVIAGVDVPWQHWQHRRRLRMSLQDLRDEMRSTEGDPHVKLRQRRLRRQTRRRRMLLEVPAATVVVTNPTHYAVALRYERGKDAAPVVVAKGVNEIALKIRRIAAEHLVPVMENPPLARALHQATEIGDVIPREHFETVARIIGLVWARSGRAAPPAAVPTPPAAAAAPPPAAPAPPQG
jgi:flagellar biosynthetic protein FlhB